MAIDLQTLSINFILPFLAAICSKNRLTNIEAISSNKKKVISRPYTCERKPPIAETDNVSRERELYCLDGCKRSHEPVYDCQAGGQCHSSFFRRTVTKNRFIICCWIHPAAPPQSQHRLLFLNAVSRSVRPETDTSDNRPTGNLT